MVNSVEKATQKASVYWSKLDCSASDRDFYSFPALRSRLCRLIFNESDGGRGDWCQYWTVEKYLQDAVPFKNALSLCCGFGGLERCLMKLNAVESITGIDIAPGAIEEASQQAARENLDIKYRVCDVNTETLPAETYDLIWGNGALHHIEHLEKVLPMLYAALRPGGFLIATEYVGPRYQQINIRQQQLINAVKHLLPGDLRETYANDKGSPLFKIAKRIKRAIFTGQFSSARFSQIWWPVPLRWFKKNDPSECVNSQKIIPVLRNTFEEVDVRYFGGSILFYALDQVFYENFDPANEAHCKILEMLFGIEDALIETGEIANDNAHIICRKKSP